MNQLPNLEYDQTQLEHFVDVTLDKVCSKISVNSDPQYQVAVAMGETQVLAQSIIGQTEPTQELMVLVQSAGLALGLPEYVTTGNEVNEITVQDKEQWWKLKQVTLHQLLRDITNLVHFMEKSAE